MITDDTLGVDTLTDKTGATVTTEATVKVHVGGKRVGSRPPRATVR